MCRWLAYSGRPVALERLLFKPERSLINQSLRARKSQAATNGDGFGIGWYGSRAEPGLYRDDRPAWNDENLRSLAAQIDARLFLAHVRASTGSASSRANCHPFRHGHWLFAHNGQIGGFDEIARELDFALRPDLYRSREGSTDSETLFYLALTFGLDDEPLPALARAAGFVQATMAAYGITEPLRLTAAATDGARVIAVRYSSDRASPTLFYGAAASVRDAEGQSCLQAGADDGVVVLSEPLDAALANWTAVPEGHALTLAGGCIEIVPFAPQSSTKMPQAVAVSA